MNGQQKAERVLQWRAYLATMENEKFFDLIRMYLGEVKTPFNKQKLIEDLSAFLRKADNKKNICSLLGKNDLKILSYISLIPSASYETVTSFFANDNFGHSIYDHIENLKERLLIFILDEEFGPKKIRINPLLEESLEPILGLEWLLDDSGKIQETEPASFFLTPMFIASFVSYVSMHPELCKANGELKKKVCEELVTLYGAVLEENKVALCVQKLLDGMSNLGLFEASEKGVLPKWEQLEKFASLDYYNALILIAASSMVHLSRHSLQKYSSVLMNLFMMIPQSGYSADNLKRLAYLLFEKNWDNELEPAGRFESILARHDSSSVDEDDKDIQKEILCSIVDNSIHLGILRTAGKDEKEQDLFVPVKSDDLDGLESSSKKILSVDTSLSVTIMPGLSLAELLPFARMMDIIHYDVAAVYEMNRHSVTRYFDTGASPSDIISLLDSYSAFTMPQNLGVIIDEWFASYSSAKLYCGYVLKLSEHNSAIAEKSPAISRHLVEKLAPGVYLLDLCDDEQVRNLMVKSGMDFTGKIRKVTDRQVPVSYPMVQVPQDDKLFSGSKEKDFVFEEKNAQALLRLMTDSLDKMEMSGEQREGLAERIERRIIINPEQLRPSSVRFEKLEALAMDYSGKIHVVENAMQTKSLVEIETEESDKPLSGIPLVLEKTSGNASVTILCSDGKKKNILLGSARSVKKIREKLEY